MKPAWYLLAIILVLVQSGTLVHSGDSSRTVESLSSQSTYIFMGQVEKPDASNLTILPATDRTALVRVQKVLRAPRGMSDLTGQLITVGLVEPDSLKTGERAVFFTNGWFYGENLAVNEVGHTSPETKEASTKAIQEIEVRTEDEKVQARIRLAAAVIVGKVTTTRSLKTDRKVPSGSEHDPDWHVAEIQVESTLKGSSFEGRVAVLFPRSTDVMWFRAPKFSQGQEGIWILQAAEPEEKIPQLGGPAYIALNPLDFHPMSDSVLMRRLVATK